MESRPSANLQAVRRVYGAIDRGLTEGDEETFRIAAEIFDPEIEVEQLTDLAGTSASYRGYRGLLRAWRDIADALEDVRFDVSEELDLGDAVVCGAVARGTGRGSGVPVAMPIGHLWEFRGGRVVHWKVFPSFDEAVAAARVPADGGGSP